MENRHLVSPYAHHTIRYPTNINGPVEITATDQGGAYYLVRNVDRELVCDASEGCVNVMLPQECPVGQKLVISRTDNSDNKVALKIENQDKLYDNIYLACGENQNNISLFRTPKGWKIHD